jgi:hypothetical protein
LDLELRVKAATILGMSRQFLVNLLERGDIPYHRAGTRAASTHAIFSRTKQNAIWLARMLRDLARAEAEEGLYTCEPNAIDSAVAVLDTYVLAPMPIADTLLVID